MIQVHLPIGGLLISIGFLAFLVNLINTIGLVNVLSLFVPEKWLAGKQPLPAEA